MRLFAHGDDYTDVLSVRRQHDAFVQDSDLAASCRSVSKSIPSAIRKPGFVYTNQVTRFQYIRYYVLHVSMTAMFPLQSRLSRFLLWNLVVHVWMTLFRNSSLRNSNIYKYNTRCVVERNCKRNRNRFQIKIFTESMFRFTRKKTIIIL